MHIIAGTHKHAKIITPKGLDTTRPSTGRLRESVFNICQHYIEGAEFLDLFAGSGAMGLEALSRGAKHSTFIDKDKESIRSIKQNLEKLKLTERATVLQGDVIQVIEHLSKHQKLFDIIFADPPYNLSFDPVLNFISTHPLLIPEGILFLESSNEINENLKESDFLHLINKRQMGKSFLLQYKKIS